MAFLVTSMLAAFVFGFVFSAVIVLPFVAGREVKEIARLSSDV